MDAIPLLFVITNSCNYKKILAAVTLILLVAGYCENTTGRYGTIMFVLIVTLIESLFIMFIMVMRYDETVTAVDVPLTLLLNDGLLCLFLFIVTNLSLMSIGSCPTTKGARLMAALFLVALFILLVVQNYFNYLRWQDRRNAQISAKSSETTVTESSSTILS
ncbi:uncharacterized protein TNCV_3843371 [Trichonephila clavipes]|nr:uncharacterized protein TNCV_3843371 [Trichonephila clavipes]